MPGQIQRTRGLAAYRRAADAAGKKPANTVLPAITGTPTVGQTLTCSNGTWTKSPTFTRQWNRNGVPIAGATASTRVLTVDDVGALMTCTVTATNAGVSIAGDVGVVMTKAAGAIAGICMGGGLWAVKTKDGVAVAPAQLVKGWSV